MSFFDKPIGALRGGEARGIHHVAVFGKTGSGKWVGAKDASALPVLQAKSVPGGQP
ncbi:hypothetical protein [Novosphingobium sp. ST904]|uniref:hypothetical protein n=1 Tax=Novosphingobium sp. ST904 TaxID=1684385 RepID=UPI000A4D9C4E|nr:hypothetical protein [Novosphingobium sp. ST904]TCM32328.1 hypothetical protein EDF59_12423 [Novosphingobium sp. ST904]